MTGARWYSATYNLRIAEHFFPLIFESLFLASLFQLVQAVEDPFLESALNFQSDGMVGWSYRCRIVGDQVHIDGLQEESNFVDDRRFADLMEHLPGRLFSFVCHDLIWIFLLVLSRFGCGNGEKGVI